MVRDGMFTKGLEDNITSVDGGRIMTALGKGGGIMTALGLPEEKETQDDGKKRCAAPLCDNPARDLRCS